MADDDLLFLDTETTGLDPRRHAAYEVALLNLAGDEATFWLQLTEAQLADAEPTALRISRYYQRRPRTYSNDSPLQNDTLADFAALDQPILCSEQWAAGVLAHLTAGVHLVAAVPSFDAGMLDAMFRRHKLVPAWHYHLVDIEALAAGALRHPPPWNSRELSQALGIPESPPESRHTALGDARWVRVLYQAILQPADG